MNKDRRDEKYPVRRKKSSKKRRRRQKLIIEKLIFITALVVFCVSAASLIKIGLGYKQGTDTYDDVFQAVVTEGDEGPEEETKQEAVLEDEEQELSLPYVDLDALRDINEDSSAWIYFPNMQINYPVVHGDDNSYYLNHMIDGRSNNAGTLFVEANNSKDFLDENTIIYGHNMKNGSMFGMLKKYGKEEYYKENPSFYLFTDEGVFKYDIFSVRVVNEMSDAYMLTFSTADEYWTYIDKAFRTSMYDTETKVTADDQIITLSTCTSADTDRLIVQAVKGIKIR